MLNNKKIETMTRLAIYEKGKGKEDLIVGHYYKLDYIRYHLLKTSVCVTLGYMMVLGFIAAYNMEYIVNNAVTLNYKQIGNTALFVYLIMLASYMMISLMMYSIKFVKAKKRLGGYNRKLKELRQMYADEENI